MKTKEEAKFIVYYDEEGEAIHIEPGKGCRIVAEGEKVTSTDFLREIMKEEKIFNVKSAAIVAVHGSPGCYIYIDKIKVCIC